MAEETNKDLRRKAYRAALVRLARAWPESYNEFRLGVARRSPEFSSWQTTSAAQRLLRDAFPHRFKEVYEREKLKLGVTPKARKRDWNAVAAKVVELYDNGNGMSLKQIRDNLKVGSDFASQAIKDAGITPKKGRRFKDGSNADDRDGEGAP